MRSTTAVVAFPKVEDVRLSPGMRFKTDISKRLQDQFDRGLIQF